MVISTKNELEKFLAKKRSFMVYSKVHNVALKRTWPHGYATENDIFARKF